MNLTEEHQRIRDLLQTLTYFLIVKKQREYLRGLK